MRLVHEDFFAPVVGDDEPEPFGRVEPFNCACAFLVVGEKRERERERHSMMMTMMSSLHNQKRNVDLSFPKTEKSNNKAIRTRIQKALPRDILPHAPTPVFFDIDFEPSESIAGGLVCYCVVERDRR